MCGRYRLSRREQLVEEYFDSANCEQDWNPRYNIAPTQPVPVISQHSKEPVRQLLRMNWGLVPSSAKDALVRRARSTRGPKQQAQSPSSATRLNSAGA